jgi:hypothetical protein
MARFSKTETVVFGRTSSQAKMLMCTDEKPVSFQDAQMDYFFQPPMEPTKI